MTRILHRHIGHSYPVAVSAEGVTIRDSAGREYIDASGGAAVLLAPPFIVDAPWIDAVVERLGEALDAATTGTF
jgi:adenosylmethionine-8-amino-7-oxononanoate aminotransferase